MERVVMMQQLELALAGLAGLVGLAGHVDLGHLLGPVSFPSLVSSL